MAKPAQKPNFLLAFLWATTILLGLNMFFNKPKDTRSLEQLQTVMMDQANKELDHSIAQTKSAYEGVVDQQVNDKKITAEKGKELKIGAAVLVADTQLRAGLRRNETSRIRNAYNTLWGYERKEQEQPAWETVVYPVKDSTANPALGRKEWTGQGLFDKISDTLSERSKHDLIWGVLPGGYHVMDTLVSITGARPGFSYAFAAFLLALVVRAIVFPFSQRQIMHGRQMQQLAPLAAQIKEQYKDEPQKMQAKSMELYKEYGINPLQGCAPAVVQMPLFLTVYQCMLLYQFEFQKGTFLWINPTVGKATHGLLAANLGQQDALLIIFYSITMIISTLLTPVSDPTNAKQQRLMGVGVAVIFTFFMFTGMFPVVSGFVLYWTFTNILSTLQSLRAYRLPLEPLQKVNAPGGGVIPVDPRSLRPAQAGNGNGKTGKPAQHRPTKKR